MNSYFKLIFLQRLKLVVPNLLAPYKIVTKTCIIFQKIKVSVIFNIFYPKYKKIYFNFFFPLPNTFCVAARTDLFWKVVNCFTNIIFISGQGCSVSRIFVSQNISILRVKRVNELKIVILKHFSTYLYLCICLHKKVCFNIHSWHDKSKDQENLTERHLINCNQL